MYPDLTIFEQIFTMKRKLYLTTLILFLLTAANHSFAQQEPRPKTNTYQKIVAQQNKYNSDLSCLRIKDTTYMVSKTVTEVKYRAVSVPGLNGKTEVDMEPYNEYHTEDEPSGARLYVNKCSKTVYIYGIGKYPNLDGSFYFTDLSIRLNPGESAFTVTVEDSYDPEKAELYSKHFYKNKLPFFQEKIQAEAKKIGNSLKVDSYTYGTNIFLKKGDSVVISATGAVRCAPAEWASPNDPDGSDNFKNFDNITTYKTGALIGKIGENGNWFLVGSEKTFTASTDGKLFLVVNDNKPADNEGSFLVNVAFYRK